MGCGIKNDLAVAFRVPFTLTSVLNVAPLETEIPAVNVCRAVNVFAVPVKAAPVTTPVSPLIEITYEPTGPVGPVTPFVPAAPVGPIGPVGP